MPEIPGRSSRVAAATSPESPAVRIAAVIPAYNHASTVATVIERTRAHLPDIIVVDDGSTDDTGRVARGCEGIDLVTLPRNRGKGAALQAGLARALSRGFTHAITLDADMQHLPDDIPLFVKGVVSSPETLWIGSRTLPAGDTPQPGRSRFGRRFGAFWYRFHTGRRIDDTQCGFRAYPLARVAELGCRGSRYEFEIEALVYAAWNGTDVRSIPVHMFYHPPDERVSHFRPVADFLRISKVNARFSLIRIFTPWRTLGIPGRTGMDKLRGFALRELRANTTPNRAAASLALGVFLAIFPIHGFQVLAAIGASVLLKLNRPLALVGVSVSSAPFLPFIIAAAIAVGKLVLPESLMAAIGSHSAATALRVGMEFVVGSSILAVVVGAATFAAARAAFSRMQALRNP